MIAILNKSIQEHGYINGNYGVLLEVPEGHAFTVMSWYNVPQWFMEEIGEVTAAKVKSGECLVFMFQVGKWYAVPRKDCEVPIRWNGLYNV